MRRLLAIFALLLCAVSAGAQTTTFNGVIKDLSNTPVPTGQVSFALKPSIDTTISGQGRFVPSTTFCEIHNPSVTSTSGTGTITVNVNTAQNWQVGDSIIFSGTADATLNASSVATPYTITLVNSTTSYNFTQSGTHTNGAGGTVGGLYKSGGTGACSVMQSSAITPANTYYSVSLWPIFSLTSSFNTYAIGTGPIDISTIVPTPGQQPAYSFMDLFSNQTVTGQKTFNAPTTFGSTLGVTGALNANGGLASGGYCLLSPNETISAALVAGCLVIDDRAGLGNRALGTIDPGANSAPVTILLGPFNNYTIVQFTVRSGLNFIGSGIQQGSSTFAGTTITSVSNTNQAPFVLPQANNGYAMYVTMQSLNLVGASGNTTQDGLQFDCSGFTNAGLWNSTLKDLFINGFNGTAVHFKGKNNLGIAENQVDTLINVHAIRPVGSGTHSLVMEGNNETILLQGGNYDVVFGAGPGSPGTNIIVQTNGTGFADSIVFDNIHTQFSAVGIQMNGCVGCAITHSHFELNFGDILLTNTASQANRGLSIDHNWFISGAQNSGSGYVLTNSDTVTDASFENNLIYNVPDNVIIGTNLASVKVRDNFFASAVPNSTGYSGTTMQLAATATMTTFGAHTIYVNSGGSTMTTINSTLGPGEYLTFICSGNFCTFSTGGNVDITGVAAPLVLGTNETATFVRNDINGTWRFVATSSAALNGKILGSPTINLLTNGTGLQVFNTTTTCTTAASVGATCTTAAITLPVAEADTNYRAVCAGKGLTGVPVIVAPTISSATQFTLTIAALTAAAASFNNYDCIVGHN